MPPLADGQRKLPKFVWQPKRIANLPACKSACWLNQIGQIDNRQNRLYVVNSVMPDCQLHIFLPAALHMTLQWVRAWQRNQIFPFLPVLWHTGGTRSRASTSWGICSCLNCGSVFATRKPPSGGKPSSFSLHDALFCNSCEVQVTLEQSVLVWLALPAARWLGLYKTLCCRMGKTM